MAAIKREPTAYPGVYYRMAQRLTGKGEERIYYCTYKLNGKKVEVRIGRQYRDDMTPARAARMRAELMEGQRKSPQEIRREAAARLTLRKLWEAYKQTYINKPSLRTDRYTINHLKEFLDRQPESLTTPDIEALRADMESKGYAAQTVRHALSLLRRIIRFGAKRDLCDMPPRLFFEMPPLDNQKTEVLTSDQVKDLLDVLDADKDQSLACLMKIALATGMRRGALLALEWRDVDFNAGFITLRGESAKSGRTERVPLNDAARGILENAPVFDSPFVFPNPSGRKRTEMRHFIKRIQKAANLPKGFRPLHGLRHTYASWLASSGEVDLYTLQRLLTHNSPQMTQRYAHLHDKALRTAANVAGGLFERKTEDDAGIGRLP